MKKDTFGTKIGKKLIEYCIINISVVLGIMHVVRCA